MGRHDAASGDWIVVSNYGGTLLRTHPPDACAGRACCVHNPSEHRMVDWPRFWRGDRQLMERLCEHGVGHPDPDDVAYARTQGNTVQGIHGCDGCCTGDYPLPDLA